MPIVLNELERLFRTNVFNEEKRRQSYQKILKKYPVLTDMTSGDINNF